MGFKKCMAKAAIRQRKIDYKKGLGVPSGRQSLCVRQKPKRHVVKFHEPVKFRNVAVSGETKRRLVSSRV